MISKSQRKKYKSGLNCVIDNNWEAKIKRIPFVCNSEMFIIVSMESEHWDGISYAPIEYEVRIPIERITL